MSLRFSLRFAVLVAAGCSSESTGHAAIDASVDAPAPHDFGMRVDSGPRDSGPLDLGSDSGVLACTTGMACPRTGPCDFPTRCIPAEPSRPTKTLAYCASGAAVLV